MSPPVGLVGANALEAPSTLPLTIGPLEIDPPVVLAPMAGVTNRAFRRLCRTYGAGLYVSEMITARALVEGNAKTLDMVTFGEDEPYRSVQLYGVDPVVMEGAVRRLIDDIGVDHIDLNFGCPAAKVTRKGGGAALPVHRALLRAVIAATVHAAGSVPVTVKLRLGVDESHLTFLESGRIAREEGAAAVALHARTAEQLYSGAADWTAIGELKAHVTGIPVLGNGDIWEASDAMAMMATTGCDGVVVGRGCLGRPWLFRDLADAFAGRAPQRPPDLGQVAAVMVTHARLLCGLFGETYGIRQFRKHVSWYLTGFPVGGEQRRAMAQLSSLAELDAALSRLDHSQPMPVEALRMARGHTNGPRPVALPVGWLRSVDDLTPPDGGDELVSGG
ncbi:MAG TPA: tRNA dihydrouridine synthase DusB [Acidimicrobiales bacterium]|jgi:nifR3 family TIM-barrel protein|nr:tRNA dihydrouridine synthase DusB [Acidimicrobiales bacterium]